MNAMLTVIDPKSLEIISNDRDLLRDLFIYIDYAREHSIKRMTRSNQIPRADLVRLAKLLDIEPPEKDDWMYAQPNWIDFIDTLALSMHLVSYDLKGEYRGYSSFEPSYLENYVLVAEAPLHKFLELSPAMQEKRILETLIRSEAERSFRETSSNEFYEYGPLSLLDRFESWGSATGIMPTLKFPEIRSFLLNVLKNFPAGQWFSTQSLVAYLKTNHPYFLIPKELPGPDRRGKITGRYDNFHEGPPNESREKTVPIDDPDAFERVEGRYVERFLEFIPLVMRFVDVAYDSNPYKGLQPSQDVLKAFRINERFLRLMQEDAAAPKVTIQPNFDVVIESDFYPANVIRQVRALGEQVSNPNSGHGAYVGIFQLKKTAVAATLVQEPELDISAMLKKLSGRDLPPNVQIELDEWAGHADQFTLYEGFSMLECLALPLEAEKFATEHISPNLHIVRDAEKLFSRLETDGQVPLRVKHAANSFTLLEETTTSIFPKETALDVPQIARRVRVSRVVTISYQFPDQDAFAATCQSLAELRCPFQSDPKTCLISLQQKDQAKFDEAIQKLSDVFAIEIE
jgi:hypothetical protein